MNKEQKLKFMQLLSEALSDAMLDQDKQFVPYEVAIKRFAEWYAEQIMNRCEPQKAYTDNHSVHEFPLRSLQ